MKVQNKNILKKISLILIFVANVAQSSWWMILATIVISPINYELLILQILCLSTRICQYIQIQRSLGLNLYLHIVSLLYYAIYIESILLLNYPQKIHIFTDCALLIITYRYYLRIAVQKYSIICRLGLPLYLLVRIILIVTPIQNLYTLESLSIMVIVFIHQLITNRLKFIKNKSINPFEQAQKEQNEKDSSPLGQNQMMQSLIRSQSKMTVIQSPKKCFTIQLKELPDELKLKRYSNLTSLSKSQKNILSQSSQNQMLQLYQNLINLFPYGILIINQLQSINYINNKCEKILECQGSEQVLEKVKVCVNSAKMQENVSETSNRQQKKQHHYHLLQQIVRKLQLTNTPVDILDIILTPQKYFGILGQKEMQIYKDFQSSFHQQIFIYEWLLKSELLSSNSQKKLKLIIIPTFMTNQQQEYISASSQIRSSSKSHISNSNNDRENPVLLIIIKNVTNKYKCKQMRDEQIINHSLIKSFSHELRTPLNSCNQMLNIMKLEQTSQEIQDYINIAQCSIALLIHQINDILDYAALQSYQFHYNIGNFTLNQIREEIEHLYKLQASQKNIILKIKIQNCSAERNYRNDKQRIVQLLVNFLNNSIKYTHEGGRINLNIEEVSSQYINFKVRDNGIGIDEHKLNQIQKSLLDTIEFGAVLKSHTSSKQAGLGLVIAARLIEGLTESKDNKLIITSKKNKGTTVEFQIEDLQQQKNILSSHFPNQQSEKISYHANQQSEKMTHQANPSESNIQTHHQQKIVILNSKNQKLENDKDFQEVKSESFMTLRLNDSEKQNQILLPISPDYFSKKNLEYYNNLQKQFQSDYSQNGDMLCQNCVHILIVDDIPFNQIALKMILNKYKIQVDQAFDGFQAVEKVKQKMLKHCSAYKLIFMDIEMPGMDGFQTSKYVTHQSIMQILELTSNQAFIVICSAYDTQENILQGKNIGINTFIQKPVKQEQLNVVLKTVFKIDPNSNFL